MVKFLINIGLFLFFAISALITILYAGLLYEKIKRPNFKNLNTESFIWLGLLVGFFVVVDYFIIRRFIKSIKRKND